MKTLRGKPVSIQTCWRMAAALVHQVLSLIIILNGLTLQLFLIKGVNGCSFWYDRVPRNPLTHCNPRGVDISLTCNVYVPRQPHTVVRWYRSNNEARAGKCGILIDENAELTSTRSGNSISSTGNLTGLYFDQYGLILRNFSTIHEGYYWCQIVANDTVLMEPSNYARLRNDDQLPIKCSFTSYQHMQQSCAIELEERLSSCIDLPSSNPVQPSSSMNIASNYTLHRNSTTESNSVTVTPLTSSSHQYSSPTHPHLTPSPAPHHPTSHSLILSLTPSNFSALLFTQNSSILPPSVIALSSTVPLVSPHAPSPNPTMATSERKSMHTPRDTTNHESASTTSLFPHTTHSSDQSMTFAGITTCCDNEQITSIRIESVTANSTSIHSSTILSYDHNTFSDETSRGTSPSTTIESVNVYSSSIDPSTVSTYDQNENTVEMTQGASIMKQLPTSMTKPKGFIIDYKYIAIGGGGFVGGLCCTFATCCCFCILRGIKRRNDHSAKLKLPNENKHATQLKTKRYESTEKRSGVTVTIVTEDDGHDYDDLDEDTSIDEKQPDTVFSRGKMKEPGEVVASPNSSVMCSSFQSQKTDKQPPVRVSFDKQEPAEPVLRAQHVYNLRDDIPQGIGGKVTSGYSTPIDALPPNMALSSAKPHLIPVMAIPNPQQNVHSRNAASRKQTVPTNPIPFAMHKHTSSSSNPIYTEPIKSHKVKTHWTTRSNTAAAKHEQHYYHSLELLAEGKGQQGKGTTSPSTAPVASDQHYYHSLELLADSQHHNSDVSSSSTSRVPSMPLGHDSHHYHTLEVPNKVSKSTETYPTSQRSEHVYHTLEQFPRPHT